MSMIYSVYKVDKVGCWLCCWKRVCAVLVLRVCVVLMADSVWCWEWACGFEKHCSVKSKCVALRVCMELRDSVYWMCTMSMLVMRLQSSSQAPQCRGRECVASTNTSTASFIRSSFLKTTPYLHSHTHSHTHNTNIVKLHFSLSL